LVDLTGDIPIEANARRISPVWAANMDGLTSNELAIAIGLAVLLGVSFGIIGAAAYANWRLRRITAGLDANGTILQQLAHERALYVNELVDLIAETKRLHASAGGVVRKMEELKRAIDASINDTTPFAPLRDLKLKSPEPAFKI
jgi:hypothetical protein